MVRLEEDCFYFSHVRARHASINIASVHYFAVFWCVCLSCISCDSYCIRLIVANT